MESTVPEVVDTGARRDTIGRVVTPKARRDELLQAYRVSGLTQAEFARREGVKYTTFAHWLQAYTKSAAAKGPLEFTEVRLPGSAMPSVLEVRLPDGTVLRGSSAGELAALIRALRA